MSELKKPHVREFSRGKISRLFFMVETQGELSIMQIAITHMIP